MREVLEQIAIVLVIVLQVINIILERDTTKKIRDLQDDFTRRMK